MKIPIFSVPDKPIVETTQDFLPIVDIVEGIVLFKNGAAALPLESTSLNFGLLSEREQMAVIAAYAGLLNSFSFPIQIVVRSQKKDISNYMHFLDEARDKLTNPKLRVAMDDYREFLVEAIKKKNVLSKKFYIVLPFSQYELGVTRSFVENFTKRDVTLSYTKSYVLRKAKVSLYPKRDHVMMQAGRLGIKLRPLTTEECISLYYTIFNPDVLKKKGGQN
jgi:hypothetical protein